MAVAEAKRTEPAAELLAQLSPQWHQNRAR